MRALQLVEPGLLAVVKGGWSAGEPSAIFVPPGAEVPVFTP